MTKEEFAAWQAITESSRFQWTEDAIFRLNGRGAFYYIGGEDGQYIQAHKDGRLEVGTYEDAFPHIGEASFHIAATKHCKDFNEAFETAIKVGGKKFLVDMFSGEIPAPLSKTSVIDTIKTAREAPRQPGDTQKHNKTKGEPEL